jgi:hypothetical protein
LDIFFSFGLSQSHGHGSWIVYEVALSFIVCVVARSWGFGQVWRWV